MSEKTVFKKIIDGEIPADVVHEDEQCLAFHDVNPQAPVHILVIPKQEIRSLDDLKTADLALAGHLLGVIRDLARTQKLATGYRVVANCGEDGGQTVDHLHFHLLGRPCLDLATWIAAGKNQGRSATPSMGVSFQ